MSERRLTRGGFLGAWAVLVALQSLALFGPLAELSPQLRLAWVVFWQVVKIAPTAWRLNDLGVDPSSAPLFALLPLANIVTFFGRMLERTPEEALRERRRARWQNSLGGMQAFGQGLALVRDTLPLGLPLVLGYAVVSALGARWALGRMDWAMAADPATLDGVVQGLGIIAGFLGMYTVLQFTKRRSASRASWFPSLLLGPTLLAIGALTLLQRGKGAELGPVVLNMLYMGWSLVWASFGGAALAVGQVLLGHSALRGETLTAGDLLTQIRRRTLDVSAPHGARVHAVTIGMQLLVPGVFYALQLAFTDIIAVLHPDQPALGRSSQLTRGMRMRLFRIFLVWALVGAAASYAIVWGLHPDDFASSFFDPRVLGMPALLAQDIVWALGGWVLQMTLLVMYLQREGARAGSVTTAPTSGDVYAPPAEAAR